MSLIWSAPFGDPSGYGTAAREYVKALYNAGVEVYIVPVNHYRGSTDNVFSDEDQQFFDKPELKVPSGADLSKYDFIRHATPNAAFYPTLKPFLERCKNIYLYSVWETNYVPKEYIPYMEVFKGILTASEFSRDAFLSTIPSATVSVVPHVIHNFMDNSVDSNSTTYNKIKSYKDKGYTVYFANLEWHHGKGYDIIIKGFLEAFKDREDVLLLLKTYNLFSINNNYKGSVIDYIKQQKNEMGVKNPIILPVIGNMNWNELQELYSVSDCYISMSRREGFGLTMSEALSHGLPIICPNKGGHREFLNKTNSIQVSSRWEPVLELELERSPYSGQKWIEPSLSDYIDKLKLFHFDLKDNHKYRKLLESSIRQTLDKFSPNKIAEIITNILKDTE